MLSTMRDIGEYVFLSANPDAHSLVKNDGPLSVITDGPHFASSGRPAWTSVIGSVLRRRAASRANTQGAKIKTFATHGHTNNMRYLFVAIFVHIAP